MYPVGCCDLKYARWVGGKQSERGKDIAMVGMDGIPTNAREVMQSCVPEIT